MRRIVAWSAPAAFLATIASLLLLPNSNREAIDVIELVLASFVFCEGIALAANLGGGAGAVANAVHGAPDTESVVARYVGRLWVIRALVAPGTILIGGLLLYGGVTALA